jgi:hypothetical protein
VKAPKIAEKEGVVFLNTSPFFFKRFSALLTALKCEIISWDWYYARGLMINTLLKLFGQRFFFSLSLH